MNDVRMRGFRRRADVAEVQAWVDALPVPGSVETVSLADAAGRVLAQDVVAEVDVPPFARAAMDGWALGGEGTFGAVDADPLELDVIGTCLPGALFPRKVTKGEAVRIMTGAPLPAGTDAVLPAEDGEEVAGRLLVRGRVPPARHVGAVGEDVQRGTQVLAPGRRLRPQDLGLAASVGVSRLRVLSSPEVGLLVTGSELVEPGEVPGPQQIVDANGPVLRALVSRDGGRLVEIRRVPDGREGVERALLDLPGEILLVSGGSSVGQEDHAPRIVAQRGTLVFHGVALRPASPAGCGLLDGRPIFLLPGNPVSCLSAYDFFAGRAVRRFAGRDPAWPYRSIECVLTRKIASVLGRMDYVRVVVRGDEVEPLMARGASILSSTTQASGFVVVPRDSEGWGEGAPVEVHLYDLP